METQVSAGIGDIMSDSRGSGARFNAGKVPYELLPLKEILQHSTPDLFSVNVSSILGHLADWQRGDDSALIDALTSACSGEIRLQNLADAARVFDYGRRKYAEWNWAKGMPWSAPFACAVRHCIAILNGEQDDHESGLPHIGHVKCNLLMLMTFSRTYTEGDDRPIRWLS